MATYPELVGRVAVITGAAQGIGAATARAFAKQGAHVALLDIDGAGAKKICDSLAPDMQRAVAFQVDVTEETSVGRAISAVATEFGGRLQGPYAGRAAILPARPADQAGGRSAASRHSASSAASGAPKASSSSASIRSIESNAVDDEKNAFTAARPRVRRRNFTNDPARG